MINHYNFSKWTTQEYRDYFEMKEEVMEKIYSVLNVSLNPLLRTKCMLEKLNCDERDYHEMLRFSGRPEVLRELEMIFLES
ncbi:MAG: hypothetical protein WCK29_01885 [archaeon]